MSTPIGRTAAELIRMKCKRCPQGRRFAIGSIECRRYGIIIREDHEGTREGCGIDAGEYAGYIGEFRAETEYPDDEWDAVDGLPGIFPE